MATIFNGATIKSGLREITCGWSGFEENAGVVISFVDPDAKQSAQILMTKDEATALLPALREMLEDA